MKINIVARHFGTLISCHYVQHTLCGSNQGSVPLRRGATKSFRESARLRRAPSRHDSLSYLCQEKLGVAHRASDKESCTCLDWSEVRLCFFDCAPMACLTNRV